VRVREHARVGVCHVYVSVEADDDVCLDVRNCTYIYVYLCGFNAPISLLIAVYSRGVVTKGVVWDAVYIAHGARDDRG
jgi:hypothetical protein